MVYMNFTRKKKELLALFSVLMILILLFWKPLYTVGAFLLLPTPDTCSLCDQEPREVPCLLNRSTGDIGTLVGTTVPGKFQFVGCLGAAGGWDSDTQTAQVTVPDGKDSLNLACFCRDCRFQIANSRGHPFVLLDLFDPKQPVTYPLEDNTVYTIRGWTVSVQANPSESSFMLAVSPTQ